MLNSRPALFVAVLEARNYFVGAANAPSGLFRCAAGGWDQLGWENLRCTAIAVAGPETLFLGAGNGVLRSRDGGATWRVTTDWRTTEVLDVALDPFVPGALVAASRSATVVCAARSTSPLSPLSTAEMEAKAIVFTAPDAVEVGAVRCPDPGPGDVPKHWGGETRSASRGSSSTRSR